jgi:hypothetical protein
LGPRQSGRASRDDQRSQRYCLSHLLSEIDVRS